LKDRNRGFLSFYALLVRSLQSGCRLKRCAALPIARLHLPRCLCLSLLCSVWAHQPSSWSLYWRFQEAVQPTTHTCASVDSVSLLWRDCALYPPEVGGVVPHTQSVNLRIVYQTDEDRDRCDPGPSDPKPTPSSHRIC